MDLYDEGLARIDASGAFLNPRARVSRDISVGFLLCQDVGKEYSLLDATAASGIRCIRYAKECSIANQTMLEINPVAYRSAQRNAKRNKVGATILNQSIQEFANTTDQKFDFIDLDPFGSPAPNMNDIFKVAHGGTIIAATATDTAVLCGAHGRACLKVYDAQPLHVDMCNEVGLRILIGYIARVAVQFNVGVEPLLSFSHANHMRSFLKVTHGSAAVSDTLSKIGYMWHCNICRAFGHELGAIPKVRACEECNGKVAVGGKLWCGKIKSERIAAQVEKETHRDTISKEAQSLMARIAAESHEVGYYSIPKMTKFLGRFSVSPDVVIGELRRKGFEASRTHFDHNGVKTGAGALALRKILEKQGKQGK